MLACYTLNFIVYRTFGVVGRVCVGAVWCRPALEQWVGGVSYGYPPGKGVPRIDVRPKEEMGYSYVEWLKTLSVFLLSFPIIQQYLSLICSFCLIWGKGSLVPPAHGFFFVVTELIGEVEHFLRTG